MAETIAFKLPQCVRESLKCASCSNYLSVAPVVYQESGLLCGRCASEGKILNPGQRATAYETLAQLFTYPCINSDNGCKEDLKWDSVLPHESTCQFRLLNCPVIPIASCSWKGTKNQLISHFTDVHKELIVNQSSYFYLPYKHTVEDNKLLIDKNNVFLFQICNDLQEGKCWLGLTSLDDNNASLYSVEFKAAESSSSMALQKNIRHDAAAPWTMDTTKMFSVDINTIKAFLDSNNILCKLEIVNSNATKQPQKENTENAPQKSNDKLLKEMECLVCYEYMVPPIFLCTRGHSICGTCKNTKGIARCPMCQANVTNMRNFALENVTVATKYPCRNNDAGCKFMGNSINIRNHEKQCVMLRVECPFGCGWKGNTNNVIEHSQKSHNIDTKWTLNDTLFRNLKSPTLVDYHLVKFDKKLFKIGFKHLSLTGPVHWVVQEIGRQFTDKPEYKYTLKFIDQSDMGRQFIINNLCFGICGSGDFRNCLIIPYQLLKPYITDEDQLIFQLSIQKI